MLYTFIFYIPRKYLHEVCLIMRRMVWDADINVSSLQHHHDHLNLFFQKMENHTVKQSFIHPFQYQLEDMCILRNDSGVVKDAFAT